MTQQPSALRPPHQTPTRRPGLCAAAAAVLCGLACSAAVASSHLRLYSTLPLTAADFKQTAPSPLPALEGGGTQTAQATTGITYSTGPDTCSSTSGTWTCVVSKVVYTAYLDTSKSWISEPNNASLLDHEQGHLDEAAAASLKAQAEVDKRLKEGALKGTGKTKDEALSALKAAIETIATDNKKAVEDANGDGVKDYDHDTKHGSKGTQQEAARARQQAALKSPSTSEANKTGLQADSQTNKSIAFDAALRRLTVDQNFIVGVHSSDPAFVPDPLDPVLGAEVLLPTFTLLGVGVNGDYFFLADGIDAQLQMVSTAGGVLLSAGLPYLQYDPVLNLFYGLTGGLQTADGVSQYVDQVVADLVNGLPALFGLEFRPELNFMVASLGFTADLRSAASNLEGLRLLSVAEPSMLALLGVGLLLLLVPGHAQRRGRPASS